MTVHDEEAVAPAPRTGDLTGDGSRAQPAPLAHEAVLRRALEALGVRQVFGEAYERDGTTVVPVASVRGGGGGGGGSGDSEQGAGSGSGVGFHISARPAGVYVIRGEEVRWEPSLDLNRAATIVAVVVVAALSTVRAALKFRLIADRHRSRARHQDRH